jgi:hypothetical protein
MHCQGNIKLYNAEQGKQVRTPKWNFIRTMQQSGTAKHAEQGK